MGVASGKELENVSGTRVAISGFRADCGSWDDGKRGISWQMAIGQVVVS